MYGSLFAKLAGRNRAPLHGCEPRMPLPSASRRSVEAFPRTQSEHRKLTAPPQPEASQEGGAGFTVARRMVGSDRVPAAVRHSDPRAGPFRLEQDLDLSALTGREVR